MRIIVPYCIWCNGALSSRFTSSTLQWQDFFLCSHSWLFSEKSKQKTVHGDKNSFLLESYNIMFTQNVLNESHLFHFCQFCVKDLWMIKCSLLCLFPDVFAFFIIANCDQHWNSTLVVATRPKYSCLFILYFFSWTNYLPHSCQNQLMQQLNRRQFVA